MSLRTNGRLTGIDGDIDRKPRSLAEVPGWLTRTDRIVFKRLLSAQEPGDLLELGTYLGKTAIHMGTCLRPGEKFTVCDLFDLARDDTSIRPGARRAYSRLTQDTFERNYLAFHDELPTIIRARTDVILDHVAPASCRFIHVDASHTYQAVRGDLLSARQLLAPRGIVVFDDYRTQHTPGTAAAVWEAAANEGLRVICLTANRFYATWGDPTEIQNDLIAWIHRRDDHRWDIQEVLGQRLVRVAPPKRREPHGRPEPALPVWKKAAVAILPPVVTAAVRRTRPGSR